MHVIYRWKFLECYFSLPRQRSRVWNRSCLCVCPSVSALMFEPFELRTWNSAGTLPLIISRTSLKVKVIGQRSRSPFWKTWFSDFFLWCDLCRLHRVILSWHLMSCDVTLHDISASSSWCVSGDPYCPARWWSPSRTSPGCCVSSPTCQFHRSVPPIIPIPIEQNMIATSSCT